MEYRDYPSDVLEKAVEQFNKLPGIGKHTALRMVLFLLGEGNASIEDFSKSIALLAEEIKFCHICHNISDSDTCRICRDTRRDHSLICVVESIRDVMAVEATSQYKGVYHVLGGIISPMEGKGPGDIHVDELVKRVKEGNISEVILALPTTMEGDTTAFYIYKKLINYELTVTSIARGVAIGDELAYTDEITLGRSIRNRVIFNSSMED